MMTVKDAIPVVLIVDDVASNIKVLADALRHDYRVKVASRGEDALIGARFEPHPDLILLDVMMPEMDGYEVCRRLKNDPVTEGIPVIFVTARETEEDQERGFQLGGVDYITKPFSIPLVKARVRTHVQLKRQADALERLSHIDPLTGIANRRQFAGVFALEFRRAVRENQPLAVLMIDIDYFKGYNDLHGHGAGDDCLRQVVSALAKGLSRSGDLVARYGGEEFVAILPATGSAAVHALAEKLRNSILALQLPYASTTGDRLTISIGGATTGADPGADTPDDLLERADKMLYHAKETGRNRTVIADTGRQ
jgi:diguanylate cyclase (GGDEF)-like protein